jgi:RND family efflux transporter MFP subunit
MKLVRNAIILLLVAAGIFAVVKWNEGEKEVATNEPDDRVALAERRDIESNLLLTGEVTPAFQFDIKPEVGGKVKKLHAITGQFIKSGEPLATIDDRDLLTEKQSAQTEIDGAQLSVEKNRGNYERAKALFEEKLISKEVFANLEADLAIAENTLAKARARLRGVEDRLQKTRILAPADGTVLDLLVNEGQVVVAAASVNSGTILMNFADLSRLLINSHVNQVDAPMLKEGHEILVNPTSGTDKPIKAKIEFIAPVATVKNNIKGFQVQALIQENDGRLKPGMSVSMNVPIGQAHQAVSVPVAAVFRDNKQSVVYVRKGGNTEKRTVEVGLTDLSFAEIKSGLQEGEEILLIEPSASGEKS